MKETGFDSSKMRNKKRLEELGEICTYDKFCDECEVKSACSQDIKEKLA